ncbi:hypothetical protein ABPG77_004440 [Micractinium sp. CCAP 211/92]
MSLPHPKLCTLPLQPVFQYGLSDGRDIVLHHCASLALIVVSYAFGLTRIGVLVLATFAISNPLLHLAKVCNQLSIPGLRLGGFLLFAAAFFITRVLLVPWAVLKPVAVDSRVDAPHIKVDFPALWWGVNGLLGLLYCLQLLWMASIVRVLRRATTHGADAASCLSAKLDPAKRYAEANAGRGAGEQLSNESSAPGAKAAAQRPGNSLLPLPCTSPADASSLTLAARTRECAKSK